MRTAILIHSLRGGGAERVTANLANWLARRGHEVLILGYGEKAEPAYTLSPAVRFESIPDPGTGLASQCKRVVRIRLALQAYRPDVALAIMSTASILLALASFGQRWRTVGAERASPRWDPASRVWRTLRALTLGWLDKAVAQTDSAARWLERHTSAVNVEVIPNAVDWPLPARKGGLRPDQVIGRQQRLLLAVGRLGPEKGFIELIESFEDLAAHHPSWDLAIVGDGAQRPILEQLIRDRGLGGRVHLPGVVPAIANWYRRAEIFALSSRHEGFPNVVMEAMAHGVPVVSRDCDDGPREIVRDGIDGILTPVNDLVSFTRAIAKLMSDDALRSEMGARAVEVRVRFSSERLMGRWEALLAEEAQGRGGDGEGA